MKQLTMLEERISKLVACIHQLKMHNEKLLAEKKKLEDTVQKLESSVLTNKESSEKERALTKEVVDELIKSIDSLIGKEDQAL